MTSGDGAPVRVLVVDDERLSRQTSARQLEAAGFAAGTAENAYRALELLQQEAWDVVLADLRMPGMDGLELLRRIRRDHPGTDVLLMTAYATVETAVAAMHEGANDYLTKPFHFQELEARLRKLGQARCARREIESLRGQLRSYGEVPGLIGGSPGIKQVIARIQMFAGHDAPVLVTGETGTGKEVVARAIHDQSARAKGPFVAVACGAIPGELAESELFGHERGAFTGATGQRAGTFERAHGGTLLLDDIDDLPLAIQVKLLRALQEGTLVRVGGSREIKVDVRVVATTKVDLAVAVREGRFRDDLFYRLRGLEIRLPPLRERGSDVLLLADNFLRRFAGVRGRPDLAFSPEAAACLRDHRWPGNVRELVRTVESAVTLCPGAIVEPQHLPYDLTGGPRPAGGELFTLRLEGCDAVPFSEAVNRFEQSLIEWAMRRAGGQQTRAAEMLGLPRTTFQSKLSPQPSPAPKSRQGVPK